PRRLFELDIERVGFGIVVQLHGLSSRTRRYRGSPPRVYDTRAKPAQAAEIPAPLRALPVARTRSSAPALPLLAAFERDQVRGIADLQHRIGRFDAVRQQAGTEQDLVGRRLVGRHLLDPEVADGDQPA